MAAVTTKRSKTLVDAEVQGSLLRRIAVHWVIFFVCNTIALMIWIRMFEQPDATWGKTFGDTLRRFLPFFVITAALIPAFVWDTLKLSHRFAGPMLRVRSTLADLKAGRAVAPLHFRGSDFWKEVATNFNAVLNLGNAEADDEEPPAEEDKEP